MPRPVALPPLGPTGLYQYFLKVVPTSYSDLRNTTIYTNQFRWGQGSEGRRLPFAKGLGRKWVGTFITLLGPRLQAAVQREGAQLHAEGVFNVGRVAEWGPRDLRAHGGLLACSWLRGAHSILVREAADHPADTHVPPCPPPAA